MALGVVELNVGTGGAKIVVDVIGTDAYEVLKLAFGAAGAATLIDPANPLPVTDAASLAALLSIAAEDFATAPKQDAGNATLVSILAKIIAAPSTEAKQDIIITGLASILAKIIAAPATEAKQDTGNTSIAAINTKTPALGQAAMAASVPVTMASDQIAISVVVDGNVDVRFVRLEDATITSVNDTDSNVELLAQNDGRSAAMIFNDSTVALYVAFGATASLTAFTVKIAPDGYYEFPQPIYTGQINGIWASNASGAARITEIEQ